MFFLDKLVLLLPCLYKRKQALLGSNLIGIVQMADKIVKAVDSIYL